ncbi:hypothetical protein KR026_003019, partial [Drosophila bipectinata]
AQSVKRQRSTEIAPQAKKRKAQPQLSNRSFAEVTKRRTLIGVLVKGFKDGLILKDLWRIVVNELHGRSWRRPADPKTILTMLRMCNPTLPTADWKVAKVKEAVGLRRQVVLTLNEENVNVLEKSEHRIKYGFEHVTVRIYKSDVKSRTGNIELKEDAQEPDLEEPTEEGHPEGMSDEEEDILEGYTSEKSDLARALRGVGMEVEPGTT